MRVRVRVRVRIASSPSRPFTVTVWSSMPTARVFSRTSTPIFASLACVYRYSFTSNGPSTAPAPSSSRIRASVVSTDR
jgi:hypothetical protein